MFNEAISRQGAPRYLSTDHDPLFKFHRWKANLRILDVDEIKTVPHTPVSHPFVERLIGTTRREFLDHVLFWNGRDLKRKLSDFRTYYNGERVHSALAGNTPGDVTVEESVKSAKLDDVRWQSVCRGLVQLPMTA
jgi:transposase InsO family protein